MKAPRTWALIADGARARIIRTPRDEDEQLPDIVFECEHKPLRDIMADRQGRAINSQDSRRSKMEYRSDPEREAEEAFASKLNEELLRHHQSGEFDSLAVIAEPRMLGAIRQSMPAALRDVVVGEAAKDLTKLPEAKLRKAVLELGVL